MEALISTKDLKKHFHVSGGLLHAVDGVNIEIIRNQTLGVVGESGCGKSTLGRLLLRLIESTSGNINFEGKDITKISKKEMTTYRHDMQMVFQDPYASLNPRMSVYQLISEPLKMNHVFSENIQVLVKVKQLMSTVGLAENYLNKYPHEMDGGRRQRIGIARALALDPKFIVCDEPVSSLDVSIQAQILNLLMDIQDEMGITYMFISHDLSVVKHISNEIAVMYLGKCIERATPDELFTNALHPYTKALISAIPIPRIVEERKKQILMGEVSDPINPKPGCRFAPRCSYRMDKCTKEEIEIKDKGNGHHVACFLYE